VVNKDVYRNPLKFIDSTYDFIVKFTDDTYGKYTPEEIELILDENETPEFDPDDQGNSRTFKRNKEKY
jgi:hypothetical protein